MKKKKTLSKLLSIAICLCTIMGLATNAAAYDSHTEINKEYFKIVRYEDFVSNGHFEFLKPTERINSDGNFTFEGNQIVSTVFKVTQDTITISATATSATYGQNYKITLYQSIDAGGTRYRSVAGYTYSANGMEQVHSFIGLKTDRKFYFVIKTTGFGSDQVKGTGTVSNFGGGA